MTSAPHPPASAANRDEAGGVEVRGSRGQLICRATQEQARAVVQGGAGRLVASGRVLRVNRDRAALAWLRNASRTVAADRVRVEQAGVSPKVWRHLEALAAVDAYMTTGRAA